MVRARRTGREIARRLAALLAVCVLPASAAPEPQPTTAGYRVIAHPETPVQTVDRAFLSRAFLKRTTRWPNGELIRPVDLSMDAPVRRRFSEDALGRSVSAVRSYWQQAIFSGRGVPPPQFRSDRDVIDYVLSHPGAIGYVSPQAEVGDAVVLSVR